ncbi:MAG TPA: MFS transporter [Planctomycetaceae bacterium]|nr:MFS transporter [Planctomycetaceae bacterium]
MHVGNSDLSRNLFSFSHRLRVRWAEVDRQDIVFNGNYFLYFDVAVTEYWRAIGLPYPHGYVDRYQQDMFAVKAMAEYHSPVSFDDEIDVYCRVQKMGRTSLTIQLQIWKGEVHTTSGQLVYVNTDVLSRKPTPWPNDFRDKVSHFEQTPPDS